MSPDEDQQCTHLSRDQVRCTLTSGHDRPHNWHDVRAARGGPMSSPQPNPRRFAQARTEQPLPAGSLITVMCTVPGYVDVIIDLLNGDRVFSARVEMVPAPAELPSMAEVISRLPVSIGGVPFAAVINPTPLPPHTNGATAPEEVWQTAAGPFE